MGAWIRRWTPAIMMMLLIYLASSIPGSLMPEYGNWDFVIKKGGHAVGYSLLSAAFLHALRRGGSVTRYQFIAAASLTFLYGITDEWHQRFTPGRHASAWDVGIDTAGGIIGLAVYRAVHGFLGNRGGKSGSDSHSSGL